MRHHLTIAVVALGVFGALAGTVHADPAETPAAGASPIATVLRVDGQHSLFAAALEATGLSGMVDACNDAHTTVFVPSDNALRVTFAAMGLTERQALADKRMLSNLVTAHVVSGDVGSAALTDGLRLTALNGSPIVVDTAGGVVSVNRVARVTTAGVAACNGVMHLIDRNLMMTSAQAGPMPRTGLVHQRLVLTVSAAVLLAGAMAMLVARLPRRRRA